MTPKEFKAWFEGFTEAMEGQPTPDQWSKIKTRVAQIDGTPTSYPVFVDRYWPAARPWYRDGPPLWSERLLGGITVKCDATLPENEFRLSYSRAGTGKSFDAVAALHALGKADYEAQT